MSLFNQFLYKKSVGEKLIYRGRVFNLLPFVCLAPLDSPPHWRSQSSGYEYLWVDVNLRWLITVSIIFQEVDFDGSL